MTGGFEYETADLLAERAQAVAAERQQAELDLLLLVLSSPRMALGVLDGIGFTHHDISEPDLRLIYLACHVARNRQLPTILRVARLALIADNYFDDAASASELGAMRWGCETLAAACFAVPFNPDVLRARAAHVLKLDRQVSQAHAAYTTLSEFIGTSNHTTTGPRMAQDPSPDVAPQPRGTFETRQPRAWPRLAT